MKSLAMVFIVIMDLIIPVLFAVMFFVNLLNGKYVEAAGFAFVSLFALIYTILINQYIKFNLKD